jgi:hypothetical protein
VRFAKPSRIHGGCRNLSCHAAFVLVTRSVRACTSPEFRRSCAMELSRAALEALGPAVLFRRFFRRTALEHAEREEAGEAGEAEHQRGLLAGEIRSRSYEILDGPSAQILRELLRAVRHAANESGEFWSVSFEILRGHTCGVHNVADHIGAGSDLHIEKTLRLLGGIGRKRESGLLGLIACLARGLGELRRGVAGLCSHILGRGWRIGAARG